VLSGVAVPHRAPAQASAPIAYVIAIDGTIDLGLAPFLSRTIREAQAAGAAAVLLDINTFGGRVDAAVAMRDALLNAPVRTIAFVNQRAISAGALIALACDTLIMTKGGTIGAAAPVLGGAGETQPADEKSVSYVRSEFRATAETRNRPPAFAEAMVDADVEIAGVIEKGKLLTLTTSQALEHQVAELTADTLDAALAAAGLPDADVRIARQTWAETLVRFLTHPVVSSLLMTVGLLGLLVEIRTPGFAIPGAIGLLSLGLFFWGHWIVQLAGWGELLLVSIGVLLLALEVFVIPGVTVAGIAGIVALVAGLGMTLVGAGACAGEGGGAPRDGRGAGTGDARTCGRGRGGGAARHGGGVSAGQPRDHGLLPHEEHPGGCVDARVDCGRRRRRTAAAAPVAGTRLNPEGVTRVARMAVAAGLFRPAAPG
jgi:membrane-bound serine protease (ClpP class)